MGSNEEFYEQQVKDLILSHESLFGDLGRSSIVYEKAINSQSIIADCLIFTEKKGVIGVEIKTAHDTTRRLNKQLKGYSAVCRYVYVLCADSQLDAVENVITTYGHSHVGIMCYDMFGESAVVGIYKPAMLSPNFSVYSLTDILWKQEIANILGQLKHPAKYREKAFGEKSLKLKRTDYGESGTTSGFGGGFTTSRIRKPYMIQNMIGLFGKYQTEKIIVNYFIEEQRSPEKVIHFYHFRRKMDEQ